MEGRQGAVTIQAAGSFSDFDTLFAGESEPGMSRLCKISRVDRSLVKPRPGNFEPNIIVNAPGEFGDMVQDVGAR